MNQDLMNCAAGRQIRHEGPVVLPSEPRWDVACPVEPGQTLIIDMGNGIRNVVYLCDAHMADLAERGGARGL